MDRWLDRLTPVREVAGAVPILARSGLLGPYRPAQLLRMVDAVRRYGVSLASVYALGAARRGEQTALIDDRGRVSFAAMEAQTSTLAAAFVDAGIRPGDGVALLCRNHRGFVQAEVALGKAGADVLYLNTGFAGPQLRDVLLREGPRALVVDEEFLPLLGDGLDLPVIVAWTEGADSAEGDGARGTGDDDPLRAGAAGTSPLSFADLLDRGPRPAPAGRPRVGRQVILTSGTTGQPKGARRPTPSDFQPFLPLLERIPLTSREVTLIAAPMFHSWGLVHMAIGLILGSTLVLHRRFDAETTLRTIAEHGVSVLVAVPVMVQRILELPPAVRRRYDTSSLRVVALTGSPLPGQLARRFMDAFGDVLYNLYGSTEVGWVSIAGPDDLRSAPGTAGRPVAGTSIRLLDGDDRQVAPGATGRIFVRGGLLFEGYTGGGGKAVVDGYMSTGDIGHLDAQGRLFVDGREDDMIISGGENLFPSEVEHLLADHPDVADVAVRGVADEEFGQRLEAYVVLRAGAQVDADSLKAYVRRHLANYKVPRSVLFVDALPRNATGKVVKAELRP